MYIKTLSVTKLNSYIKKVMDNDFILRNICVKGEISNLKIHSSGHIYFSLKDGASKINCIMFESDACNLTFTPENGNNVIVKGRVSTYPKEGLYQLYCNEMEIEGIGQLHIAFEKLKKKLENQGLFDEDNKKRLPKYPRKIGVITSASGAAVRDVINVAKRRNPFVDLLIYPSLVQGEKASEDLIKGIKYLQKIKEIDVIILARGGGSIEELWAFNDEALAYEIYKCNKPVVTGVGHETDFTIADFVGDRRAPTPSAAAEIVVPNINEINQKLDNLKTSLSMSMKGMINDYYSKFEFLHKKLELNNPNNYIVNLYNTLDNYNIRLKNIMYSKLNTEQGKLQNLKSLLFAHNPLNILDKGYAILENDENTIIKNIEELKKNECINIKMKDGESKFKIEFLEDI
ncbi:exodeoxyribonuclease VII large subunit [Haloimpatiens sp. FM7330]|uniref:exodeoxyribonuclease VII large subunit n=1 Tax=Haloimpatiens sp. FM7330 TaxID=3298610 RepID=UPI00364292BD